MSIFSTLSLAAALAIAPVLCAELPSEISKNTPCKKVAPQTPPSLLPAYNAPAGVQLASRFDLYATGSFIYWQALQDNMELGAFDNPTPVPGFPTTAFNSKSIEMDFDYKPGFKIGLGMTIDRDAWGFALDYTWFRGTNSKSSSVDPAGVEVILPRFGNADVLAGPPIFTSASETWKAHLDLLDATISRNGYTGKFLAIRPFFAVRAAWIRQRVDCTYHNTSGGDNHYYENSQKSNSWALGPKAGFSTSWLLGHGFDLYAMGSGDLLYTNYPTVASKTTYVDVNVPGDNQYSLINQKSYGCLRTHLELEAGFNWGTYFAENKWHLGFSAGYNCQVFFRQNMFLYGEGIAYESETGDLYLQGLTLKAAFDF